MSLADYDPYLYEDSLLDYRPTEVSLQRLLDEVGGFLTSTDDELVEHCACIAEWLLRHAKFENYGCAGAVLSVQLADRKLAIKAGIVLRCEAELQDAVEKELHLAPPVYSYLPDLELSADLHRYLCPYHGPAERRGTTWKKDAAPCFCRYGLDLLIMPFCDRRVLKSEVDRRLDARLQAGATKILKLGQRFKTSPEAGKTPMWLNGQVVFVDFGDACALETLNLIPPEME